MAKKEKKKTKKLDNSEKKTKKLDSSEKKTKKLDNSEKQEDWISISRKQQNQLLVILVTIGVIFIIVFTIYILAQKSKKFEYNGMKFERIMYDQLPLYYTQLNIHRGDGSNVNYNLYLRNDPRGNNIPVDADIKFLVGKSFITIGDGLENCREASLGLINLASFLTGMGFDVKGASSNEKTAKENNHPYITCNNSLDNTVLSLETTTEDSIITNADRNPNCFILKVKDCNVLNITEKFTVEMIKQVWRE